MTSDSYDVLITTGGFASMAMGAATKDRQGDLMVGWAEMPTLAGSCVLRPPAVGADRGRRIDCLIAEVELPEPYYAARMGAPSKVPPVVAISACTWWATSEGIRLTEVLQVWSWRVARIPKSLRPRSPCDWGAVSGCRTIPDAVEDAARACPQWIVHAERFFQTGFWP